MKYVTTENDHLVFQIGKREKALLLDLLQMYPLVPPDHHRLTTESDSPGQEANQLLLEEALAEHRRENRKQLEAMLQEPHRFRVAPTGYRLHLTPSEVEWVLQLLNDIRVGSWLLLGSPDAHQGKRLRLNLQNARYLWAMELAGHFQNVLLSATHSN